MESKAKSASWIYNKAVADHTMQSTCKLPRKKNNCSSLYYCIIPVSLFQSQALIPSVCCLWSSGWGEWTEWGDCDEEGLQHRTRRCGEEQEAEASLCQGNITQSRPCQPHEVPGKRLLFLINCWNKFGVYSKLLQTVADISWKNPVRVTQKFNQTQ